MRGRAIALLTPLLVTSGAHAEAKEPARLFDVGASLGYAIPLGSAETGSRVSDTTYGIVPVELDAVYRLTVGVGVGAWVRYGASIPTLCTTANDCESSIGRDIAVAARVRFFLPRLGPLRLIADAGVGYEWFASKLTDGGATSTRAYRGPLLFTGSVASPFHLSARWTLGPVVGATVGTFTNRSLESPAIDENAAVHGRSVHAWLSLGARLAMSF
jgi:hypothetical protein